MSIGLTTAEPTAVESQSARQLRESDSSNASGVNAFAATLANAMQPTAPPAPQIAKDGADSELDSLASGVGARKTDGKAAFAAAAEARTAAATTPVDAANSDTDALNPDFRARLGRVITRMHDEFGKDVQLVEGFRTQSRQDFLYDQGRTRPGEVVTWTKSSKHTLGLAADVTIDGSYTDSVGFQQLAQVAAQEG
ncbi:MAG TPA: M15 family metallopeptidase, partial [Gemmatimonadaceae bacterium]